MSAGAKRNVPMSAGAKSNVPMNDRDEQGQTGLSRRLRQAQADQRLPAVSAEVRRGPDRLWSDAVHAGPQHAFRIGSITKTFTAALVMQCRDDGLLSLEDRVADHLDVRLDTGVTIRRALSHLAGLQREPADDVWAGGPVPDEATLLAGLARAEQVLPPARRFHYSNLAFALLGQVVAACRGTSWESALSERLLQPLGLTRTSVTPGEPFASGGFTEPWSDHVRTEPMFATGAVGPAAQLWSTASDVARWGVFLTDPDPAVLAPSTAEEMAEVAVMADSQRWNVAYGLGLMLFRRGDRILVGHGGAMPGFLAAVVADPETHTSAAVLTAAGRGATPDELAMALLEESLDADPPPVKAWQPADPAPADVRPLLGHWWTEGMELVFSWHDRLEARVAAAPSWRAPAVFTRLAGDPECWRTVSGREAGELLRVVRSADGAVTSLHWATYALTRDPTPFADLLGAGPRPDAP
ncbi:MAG: serine hydrolase domain-containing protein [Mycobacteriales bacterium]